MAHVFGPLSEPSVQNQQVHRFSLKAVRFSRFTPVQLHKRSLKQTEPAKSLVPILLQTHQILLLRRMTSFRLSTPPMDVAALFLPQSIAEQHLEDTLFDGLSRLQLMRLSISVLKLEDTLFDGLSRLQLMRLSISVLKVAQHHAIAITEQHPIALVRKPLPDHKLERQATILEGCKVGIEKRNNTDIADLRLEATKRKLNDAYQEAENS
ncbi:hypothetical protein OsI_01419 [Oryza sativa Indica Group]|uniref:Uncharacterized protein n=1 Tax=Oryza sativa subsp. indica TaxID=39946 RepID=B8ACL1_ORYSI|nr:hypothetical protein OsI_01419 [Oryza sativa Indica Group]